MSVRVSTLRPVISACSGLMYSGLDWITMRAMEKDRARRYQSASEFAADLERHLRNEPVLARQPSAVYRAGKFIRPSSAADPTTTPLGGHDPHIDSRRMPSSSAGISACALRGISSRNSSPVERPGRVAIPPLIQLCKTAYPCRGERTSIKTPDRANNGNHLYAEQL